MSTKIDQIKEYIKSLDTNISQNIIDLVVEAINNKIWDIINENNEKNIMELLTNPIYAEYIKIGHLIRIYHEACGRIWLEIVKKLFERKDRDEFIKHNDYEGFRITRANFWVTEEIIKLHIELNDEEMIKLGYYHVFRYACGKGWGDIVELLIEKYRNILLQMDLTRDSRNGKCSMKNKFCEIVENAKSGNKKSNYINIVRLLIDLYGDKIASKDIIDEFDEKNDEKNDKKNDEKWKLIHEKELKEKYLEKIEGFKDKYLSLLEKYEILLEINKELSEKNDEQENKLKKIALVLQDE